MEQKNIYLMWRFFSWKVEKTYYAKIKNNEKNVEQKRKILYNEIIKFKEEKNGEEF